MAGGFAFDKGTSWAISSMFAHGGGCIGLAGRWLMRLLHAVVHSVPDHAQKGGVRDACVCSRPRKVVHGRAGGELQLVCLFATEPGHHGDA